MRKEEVVSSNGNIQAVDWDCNPDIKTVELDSCDIDKAVLSRIPQKIPTLVFLVPLFIQQRISTMMMGTSLRKLLTMLREL